MYALITAVGFIDYNTYVWNKSTSYYGCTRCCGQIRCVPSLLTAVKAPRDMSVVVLYIRPFPCNYTLLYRIVNLACHEISFDVHIVMAKAQISSSNTRAYVLLHSTCDSATLLTTSRVIIIEFVKSPRGIALLRYRIIFFLHLPEPPYHIHTLIRIYIYWI